MWQGNSLQIRNRRGNPSFAVRFVPTSFIHIRIPINGITAHLFQILSIILEIDDKYQYIIYANVIPLHLDVPLI